MRIERAQRTQTGNPAVSLRFPEVQQAAEGEHEDRIPDQVARNAPQVCSQAMKNLIGKPQDPSSPGRLDPIQGRKPRARDRYRAHGRYPQSTRLVSLEDFGSPRPPIAATGLPYG